jgi:hypothetical protein
VTLCWLQVAERWQTIQYNEEKATTFAEALKISDTMLAGV